MKSKIKQVIAMAKEWKENIRDNFYVAIFKAHRALEKHVFNTENFVSWLYAVICVAPSLINLFERKTEKSGTQGILKLDNVPIAFYILSLIFYFLIKILIQKNIKNTGVINRFTMPGKYLVQQGFNKPCLLKLDGIDKTLFHFATEEMAELSADLNLKGYSNGLWHTNKSHKLKRNSSHIRKNQHSIMFFKFHEKGPVVGFSHILPVSVDTWNLYMAAGIKDNELGEDYVCPDHPKYRNETPYGLVLFSLVCAEINQEQYFMNKKNYHLYLGDFLEQVKVFHIKTLLKKHFSDEKNNYSVVNVLLQNEDEKTYKSFFRDCAKMDKKSADNCTIIHFTVANDECL